MILISIGSAFVGFLVGLKIGMWARDATVIVDADVYAADQMIRGADPNVLDLSTPAVITRLHTMGEGEQA